MLKAPGYNSSLQPAITNTITANPQRSTLECHYTLRVPERKGGEAVLGVLMPVGGGHFLKMMSCSHIKFALNDAKTLNETKFDLYKCMMRCHV